MKNQSFALPSFVPVGYTFFGAICAVALSWDFSVAESVAICAGNDSGLLVLGFFETMGTGGQFGFDTAVEAVLFAVAVGAGLGVFGELGPEAFLLYVCVHGLVILLGGWWLKIGNDRI